MFSGIGAPEVAMPHWEFPWHAEIEKFPSTVMAARHPRSVNLGDVTAHDFVLRARSIAVPDVLVFGSPCQDFSVAGRRAGLDGKRGNLSMVALGILGRLRPRWFCFENVPGLLSIDKGQGFQWFLRHVDELGYFGAWASLDAQYFGVAQRRKRVFFVGHIGDWRYPAAVLLEPQSLCGNHPPRREAREGTAPTLSARTKGGGGLGTDFDCDGGLIAGTLGTRSAAHPSGTKAESDFMVAQPLLAKANSSHDDSKETYVAHTLNAKGGAGRQDYESETLIPTRHGGSFDVAHSLRADGFDASEDGTGCGTPIVAFDCKAGGNTGFSIGEIAGALRGEGFGGGHAAISYALGSHAGAADGVATNRSHASGGPTGSGISAELSYSLRRGRTQAIAASSVRRLTPRECERLQGFPDDYTAVVYRKKAAADGPRYKALGNSMAVPVMRWILSRIEAVDALRITEQAYRAGVA